MQTGAVGLPEVAVSQAFDRPINTLAPGTQLWIAQGEPLPAPPGLWVRDLKGSYGIALRIYPSGIAIRQKMESLP